MSPMNRFTSALVVTAAVALGTALAHARGGRACTGTRRQVRDQQDRPQPDHRFVDEPLHQPADLGSVRICAARRPPHGPPTTGPAPWSCTRAAASWRPTARPGGSRGRRAISVTPLPSPRGRRAAVGVQRVHLRPRPRRRHQVGNLGLGRQKPAWTADFSADFLGVPISIHEYRQLTSNVWIARDTSAERGTRTAAKNAGGAMAIG